MRCEHADVQRTGEDVLLVDRAAASAFRLDGVAALIAEGLGSPTTLELLYERTLAEFDIGRDDCERAVSEFVLSLEERGFVEAVEAPPEVTAMRRRYLDLLARTLTNLVYPEHELRVELLEREGPGEDRIARRRLMRDIRYEHAEAYASLVDAKLEGRTWRGRPAPDAHTMVGLRRLRNLERCATRIFADGIPGDFLEAGVCQGGASIFLRALQVAYDEADRRTWLADSFAGLPEPTHPADVAERLDLSEPKQPWLAAGLRAVQDNFATYGLLSDGVRFLPGWFADTLPSAPVEQIALLRLDGDLYISTWDTLVALYDRVSVGGYIVVDDYGCFEACRQAVQDFLAERGLTPDLRPIDWSAVFWRKTA